MKLRIIHTADWHLGQRFFDRQRTDTNGEGAELNEHQVFLDWLLQQLEQTQADALLVSGDVFDVGIPPAAALRQYYNFLGKAAAICPNIVVTGGNHDSPFTLNAPADLLRLFAQIHVLGGAANSIEQHVIPLHDRHGQLLGVVAAIPFLRHTDLYSYADTDQQADISQKIREGLRQYFDRAAQLLLPYRATYGVPLLAMGHLFAAGLGDPPPYEGDERNSAEKDIYLGRISRSTDADFQVGNVAVVGSEVFGSAFDYVALGHIHKPMVVNGQQHIRYCGSPLPLSFSERHEHKQVLMADFEDGKLTHITPLATPRVRALVRCKGRIDEVLQQLQQLPLPTPQQLPTWVEVVVQTPHYLDQLEETVRNHCPSYATLLQLKQLRTASPKSIAHYTDPQQPIGTADALSEMTPERVFMRRCEMKGIEVTPVLQDLFAGLLNDMLAAEQQREH